MYQFIFKMSDNTKNIIYACDDNLDFIWDCIEEFCEVFENENNKVKSIMQVKM